MLRRLSRELSGGSIGNVDEVRVPSREGCAVQDTGQGVNVGVGYVFGVVGGGWERVLRGFVGEQVRERQPEVVGKAGETADRECGDGDGAGVPFDGA